MRVLDLTHIVAGPFCTLLLADAGADVVKIEPPGRGETSRRQGPFLQGAGDESTSAYFMRLNRNKKSVTLDLKSPEGKHLFLRLVARSDVVVENFAPGVMSRLGLGYEVLRNANPKIVYAALSGYGDAADYPTPYAHHPAMAVAIEAFSGLMDLAGGAATNPAVLGFPVGDIFAGSLAAFGIAAAVRDAETTGEGQHLDVAMFDAAVALNERALTHYSLSGEVLSRNNETQVGPMAVYLTKDGHLTLAAAIEDIWRKFCAAIERPDLVAAPGFETGRDRARNHDRLRPHIEAWTRTRTTQEAVDVLIEHGVPAAAVRDARAVFEDPALVSRRMLVDVNHPIAGQVRLVGNPVKFLESDAVPAEPPSLLGQHTVDFLGEVLGLDQAELGRLREESVI
ncbi:CaiB/BaiF CoA transferase family protein [Actinophytocola sp.]|uniref:CaiB/BaiF CoA transferase family protein n=1 Tax=Actinophytocola sp. TaxID=1872138 RepID=UPI003D6B42A1